MFKYWQGYEIDGSDTSFDIVLPNIEKVNEFMCFFMSLPIWDKSRGMSIKENPEDLWAPHRDMLKLKNKFDVQKALDMLDKNGVEKSSYIVLRCFEPDDLPINLREEIYRLSADGDSKYAKVKPSVGWLPINSKDIFNVGLVIDSKEQTESKLTLEITYGPSFVEEYILFISKKLNEQFPELNIKIDSECFCACTLSTGLYAFEKIAIKTDNLTQTMDLLVNEKIIKPVILKQQGKQQQFMYDETRFYPLESHVFPKYGLNNNNVTSKEYVQLLEQIDKLKIAQKDKDSLSAIRTAVDFANNSKLTYQNMCFIIVQKIQEQNIVQLVVPQQYRQMIEGQLKEHNISYS